VLDPEGMPSFSAELVERAPLSPRVMRMTFRASEPFLRAAGQYVLIALDDGTSHAFSIASPFLAQEAESFEIAVARGTTAEGLLDLPLGGRVAATGPSGALVWQGEAPSLLVATGTGISPLRAIVKEQLARSTTAPLVLLFGCRDEAEELWGSELRALMVDHPRFRFLPTHSQPSAAARPERVGRVQAHLHELVQVLGLDLHAYLCGHTPMVGDCTRLLLAQGVPASHVYGESY
jgi:ferredoxin-NADP reductase